MRNAIIPPTALRMLRAVENPRVSVSDLNLRTLGVGRRIARRGGLSPGGAAELGLTINEYLRADGMQPRALLLRR